MNTATYETSKLAFDEGLSLILEQVEALERMEQRIHEINISPFIFDTMSQKMTQIDSPHHIKHLEKIVELRLHLLKRINELTNEPSRSSIAVIN